MRMSIESFLLGYLGSRCDVSSQHKLPGIEEIEQVFDKYADYYEGSLRETVVRMVEEGRLFQYGPYYSDHEIDVL